MTKEEFLQEILGNDDGNFSEYIHRLDEVIKSLSEREQLIVDGRSKGLTYKQCGLMLEVSTERARQIYFKVLRRLRHPTRARILKGISPPPPIEEPKKLSELTPLEIRSQHTRDLELSVRSSNGLLNANILTIGELMDTPREKLAALRNIGRKSINEIKEILDDMDLPHHL